MPTFPIIPADVFRGSGYEGIWSMLVSHYQDRSDVVITTDTISETASNGSILKYQRIDASQTITWQLSAASST